MIHKFQGSFACRNPSLVLLLSILISISRSRSPSRSLSRSKTMGLLSNRIGTESLKPWDHIYSWRTAYVYAHHGIYVSDDKVIHFTRGRGLEVGTGTALRCSPSQF